VAQKRKWRRHTVEFKRAVVERMKSCENIRALARERELERKLLYTWRCQLEGWPEPRHANLAESAQERQDKHLREEIAKLKSALADKTLENDFFRSALQKIEEHRQTRIGHGGRASTRSSARGSKSKAN